MLEDTDSGVVCTDNTDIDNDNSDSTKHDDSQDHTETETENNNYPLVTSRRVYLNHRNITKMKDIKYKRITKSKSKSMEELRDKLRKGLHFSARVFLRIQSAITTQVLFTFNQTFNFCQFINYTELIIVKSN